MLLDSGDGIRGLPGAGDKAANDFVAMLVKDGKLPNFLEEAKKYYHYWFTEVLKDKLYKKQMAEFLKQYKIDNKLSRFTAKIKREAESTFLFDSSEIKTAEQIDVYFEEMYNLLYLLRTEEEGKKYGFKMPEVIIDDYVDWEEAAQYALDMEDLEEEIGEDAGEVDFLDDL